MKVSIPFGKGYYSLNIDSHFDILKRKQEKPLQNVDNKFTYSYDNPIYSKPLKELVEGKNNIMIVVSDRERPVPSKTILNTLLPYLEKEGFTKKNISFIIASGAHGIDFEKDALEILGNEIWTDYKVYFNNCTKEEDYIGTGYIEDGIEVRINKHFFNADFKILTGLINPHVYAGYSGGRKSVIPGLCSSKSWPLIHGVKLMDHPGTRLGNLKDNWLHKIGTKVARISKVDFIINVTLTSDKKISGIYCGDLERAFETGVKYLEDQLKIKTDKKYDIAISNAGGHPLDANFFQMIKGMSTPAPYLKKGGEIITIAEGKEGMGIAKFVEIAQRILDLKQWRKELDFKDYEMEQWTFQAYHNLFNRAKVKLVSPLFKKEPCLKNLIEEIEDLDSYLDKKIKNNPDIKIGVFLDGPYCL
ncbi:nickel-dependent lactate racemase [Actinomycetota bacterium]